MKINIMVYMEYLFSFKITSGPTIHLLKTTKPHLHGLNQMNLEKQVMFFFIKKIWMYQAYTTIHQLEFFFTVL